MVLSRFPPALLLSAVCVTACTTNSATQQSQFLYMDEAQEIRIGTQAVPELMAEGGGEVQAAVTVQYVRDLGLRLAAVTERPHLPWEVHVLDTSVVNAFALPGGKMFVTRGILDRMTSEAQLAGVMGHECGHVTARHANDRMVAQVSVALLAAGLGIAGEVTDKDYLKVLGVGAAVGGQLFVLKYSRDQESMSDRLGVRYMTKLGYNPVGQIQVMKMLQEVSGGGGGPEWFMTHPDPARRVRDLETLIPKDVPDYQNVTKYRFAEQAYAEAVRKPLSKLPPPRAGGKSALMSPVDFQATYGLPFEKAAQLGCSIADCAVGTCPCCRHADAQTVERVIHLTDAEAAAWNHLVAEADQHDIRVETAR